MQSDFASRAKSFSVRATISAASVHLMPALVKFFVGHFGPKVDIVFEPLVPIGRAVRQACGLTPRSGEFARRFWEARVRGLELGVKVATSAFNPNRIVSTFCNAMCMPSFTVTTGGVVTTCERDCDGVDYRYGVWARERHCFGLDPKRLDGEFGFGQCSREMC